MNRPLLHLDGSVTIDDVPEGCEYVAIPVLPGAGDTVSEKIFKRCVFVLRGDSPYLPRTVFVENDDETTLRKYIEKLLTAQYDERVRLAKREGR